MAKTLTKDQTQKLRRLGTSISDIALQLGVSKSTASMWCRDITITETALQKIAVKSGKKSVASLLQYSEKQRKVRQKAIIEDTNRGKMMVDSLSSRDIFYVGLGLYWGEGYKQGSQEFGFTNSDVAMIRFYIKWLHVVFKIKSSDLILRVSINQSHELRIREVEEFWSKETRIPLAQFTKPSLIKTNSKKVYTNAHKHFGTLRVKVRRGTSQRRIVLGAISSLQNQ